MVGPTLLRSSSPCQHVPTRPPRPYHQPPCGGPLYSILHTRYSDLKSAASPRPSDPSRFFGDRINLVLQEHELGLHGRDFPGELFVLGDELLEEGDDAFVMLVSFHVSECGCVRKNIRRRHAYVGRRRLTPGGEGRRPIGQFL